MFFSPTSENLTT